MAACTKRLLEGTKGLGRSSLKESIRGCFMLDSFCLSKKSVEAVVFVGVYLIGIVKTNTKVFCKAAIEGFTKYWPGGS